MYSGPANNLLDTDSDGKIFMSIRNWDPEKDGLLNYSNLEEFMRFLDKYAKYNINGNMLKKWTGQNRNKTLIHKLKPDDLAYVMLVYEAKWAFGRRACWGWERMNAQQSRSTTKKGAL